MSFTAVPGNTKEALDLLVISYKDVLEEYEFYLAGGTALALQIGHRVSYDLDFFTKKEFNPETLLIRFQGLEIENTEISYGTVKFYLKGCQVSFFYYPYKMLKNTLFLKEGYVQLGSILDIGLMKITAIADRGLKKDFYDLYYISKELGGLKILTDQFCLKYPNSNLYHYLKSLTYFEEAEFSPEPIKSKQIEWGEIKEYFNEEIKKVL